jgi:hypothetical protein
MKFTKLDLTTQLPKIIQKHQMGAHRDLAGAKRKCKQALEAEIDRQVKIYCKEEKTFHQQVAGKLDLAKELSAGLNQNVTDLENAWDDQTFAEMPKSLARIEKFRSLIKDDWVACAAHQDFRGNSCFGKGEKAAKEFLGDREVAALIKRYKDGRAPYIDVMADVKAMMQKLEEYSKRGTDAVKTAKLLQKKAAGDLAAVGKILKQIAKSKTEILGLRDGMFRDFEKHVERMVKFNAAKGPDQQQIEAAKVELKAATVDLKKHKPTIKTAEQKYNNLVKVAGEFAGDVPEIGTTLQTLNSEIGTMKTRFKGFASTYKQFSEKLSSLAG